MQNSVYNMVPCKEEKKNHFYLHNTNKFICQIYSHLLICKSQDLVPRRPLEPIHIAP